MFKKKNSKSSQKTKVGQKLKKRNSLTILDKRHQTA